MSKKIRCDACDRYEKVGHNYCKMCGFHLRKGFAPNAAIKDGYNTSEKYCGYCGKLRKNDCKCG